jgi:hypothetical protein
MKHTVRAYTIHIAGGIAIGLLIGLIVYISLDTTPYYLDGHRHAMPAGQGEGMP